MCQHDVSTTITRNRDTESLFRKIRLSPLVSKTMWYQPIELFQKCGWWWHIRNTRLFEKFIPTFRKVHSSNCSWRGRRKKNEKNQFGNSKKKIMVLGWIWGRWSTHHQVGEWWTDTRDGVRTGISEWLPLNEVWLIGVFIDTQTFSVPTNSYKDLSSDWVRSVYYIR